LAKFSPKFLYLYAGIYGNKYSRFTDKPTDQHQAVVFNDFELGKENHFKIFFKANPKPLHATWTLNGDKVDQNSNFTRYQSTPIEQIEVCEIFMEVFQNKTKKFILNHVSIFLNLLITFLYTVSAA
jgi:hypothetical protein